MRPFDYTSDFAGGQAQEAALRPWSTGIAGVKGRGRPALLCERCH